MRIILAVCTAAIALTTAFPADARGVQNRREQEERESLAADQKVADDIKDAAEAFNTKDYAKAIELASKVIRAEPSPALQRNAYLIRSFSLISTDKCPEAIPDLDFLIAQDISTDQIKAQFPNAEKENADYLVQRGQCHEEAGDSAKALADYAAALKIDPTNAPVATQICFAHYNAKAWAAAVPACEQAVALSSGKVDPLVALAASYEMSGDKTKALAAWEQVLVLEPGNMNAKDAPKRMQ